MRLILALGAVLAATTALAHAQTEERTTDRTHIVVHRAGGHGAMDADNDGWISRAESSAAADRIFAELDRNDDGRLTQADRPAIEEFDIRVGDDVVAPDADDDNCTRTETGEGENRRITVICQTARETSEGGERDVRRHVVRRADSGDVIIRRHGEGGAVVAPMAPHPPHPPMFTFVFGDDSEADLNNDGAISQDEFRTQHLRMFDAQDANGDGRVRAHRMPAPPTPPTPPTPPSPPRRG